MGRARQLNFRISEVEHELLEAAAFLAGQSPTEFCRTTVLDRLGALERDADVRKAAEARASFQARRAGKVADLPEKKASGSDGADRRTT